MSPCVTRATFLYIENPRRGNAGGKRGGVLLIVETEYGYLYNEKWIFSYTIESKIKTF